MKKNGEMFGAFEKKNFQTGRDGQSLIDAIVLILATL